MSCEELEGLVKKIALALVLLFVSGFSVLYYTIRTVACYSTDLCSRAYLYENNGIYNLDMLAIFFVISALFIAFLAYISSRLEG
ncbi:hypothetical protein [Thermococcus sp.]|uniref:hypothetical protein n=1 Tax=Thermococcus sp. TaxID=35749 RepID=UPI002610DD73|nr:hypothetical protein [Thermococcus sp.]